MHVVVTIEFRLKVLAGGLKVHYWEISHLDVDGAATVVGGNLIEELLRLHRIVRQLQHSGIVEWRVCPEDREHRRDKSTGDDLRVVLGVERHSDGLAESRVIHWRLLGVEVEDDPAIEDERIADPAALL